MNTTAPLLSQDEVDDQRKAGHLSPWGAQAYTAFCEKIADPAFPCTFGTIALKKRKICFVFIEESDPSARLEGLVEALTAYAAFITATPLVSAVMQPLAILMPPPSGWTTLDDYFYHSWRLLEAVHRRDPQPWPSRIPEEPEAQGWSFCFNGVPLFVNVKTPLHERRRSRKMPGCYLWLVQAREGFDLVAGNTPQGHAARHRIREKLAAYDDLPIYPALGFHNDPDNRDWKEYFIPETNAPITTVCPFTTARAPRERFE